MAPTVAGPLSSEEAAALLAPFAEFSAFVADMTTIRVVTQVTEASHEGHAIRAFNLIHTAGSAGGLLHGTSGFRVFTAELAGPARPASRLVPRGLAATLRHVLREKVGGFADPAFEAAYLVLGDDADGIRAALPPDARSFLATHRPDVEIELRGHRLVAHRRGTVEGAAQRHFIESLAPVVPRLARGGYRG